MPSSLQWFRAVVYEALSHTAVEVRRVDAAEWAATVIVSALTGTLSTLLLLLLLASHRTSATSTTQH